MIITLPNKRGLAFTLSASAVYTVLFFAGLSLTKGLPPDFGGLFGFLFLPLIIWLFDAKLFQKVFAFSLVFLMASTMGIIAETVSSIFIGHGEHVSALVLFILLSSLLVTYAALMFRFGKRFFQRLFEHGKSTEWALYSFGAMLSIAAVTALHMTSNNATAIGLLVALIIWSFAVLCFAIINVNEKAKQRYEAERQEREFAEEKALLESLNRTKSEFYGNISHEMKTPLTIIATDIQLAEQFIDEGKFDSAKEFIREAWQETMQTADLVTDALTFARGQETAKPMELFDFGAAVNAALTVFEPLIKKQNNTLKRDIAKFSFINGNADMLVSALINLLSNANRYTLNGIIKVQLTARADKFLLTVSDNGFGVSPELLPRLFERGVTDGTGTGLGLALVKSVAELHGGEVIIESEPGKGTAVTLAIPKPAELGLLL